MCEGYSSHSVCLSVTKLVAAATYTLFASPKCSVIRFLMVFQMHVLCGFCRNCFVCCHYLIGTGSRITIIGFAI